MKTFKTKRAMKMAAKRLEAALNERLTMFSEPATVEIKEHQSNFVSVEVCNENSYILTSIEVNEMLDVANGFFKEYDSNNWYIKFDTKPTDYNPNTGNYFYIPTMVIVLLCDDLKNK